MHNKADSGQRHFVWSGKWIGLLWVLLAVTVNGPGMGAEVIRTDGFEDWIKMEPVPEGWRLGNAMFPSNWVAEGRPGESGDICRLINDPADQDRSGKYSLFLSGRILSSPIKVNPREQVRVSIRAKGVKGLLKAVLRQYGEESCRKLHSLSPFLKEETTGDWKDYSDEFSLQDGSFAQLDLEANGVSIDAITLTRLSAGKDERSAKPILYSIPMTGKEIRVDGVMSTGEWDNALSVVNGFLDFERGNAVRNQADVFMTADEQKLYLCVREPRRQGSFKATVKEADGNVFEDESVEVHVNPCPQPDGTLKTVYQFVFNPLGTVFDVRKEAGGVFRKEWNCSGFVVGSKVEGGYWTLEAGIPLQEIGVRAGERFDLNVCRNLQWPVEHVNLSGKAYNDLNAYAQCRIDGEAPALQWGYDGDMENGRFRVFAIVKNASSVKRTYDLDLRLETDMPKSKRAQLVLEPNQAVETSVMALDRPVMSAIAGIDLNGADGQTAARHAIRINVADLKKKDAGLGTQANRHRVEFFPVQGKLDVRLVNLGEIPSFRAGEAIGSTEISVSKDGKRVLQSVVEKPLIAGNDAHITVPFSPKEEGTYAVRAVVHDKDGNGLVVVADAIENRKLDWLGNSLGKDRVVIPPFTPLAVRRHTVSCWGRETTLGDHGFPLAIRSQGEDVLTEPIDLVLEDAGGERRLGSRRGKLTFTERAPDCVEFTARSDFDGLDVVVRGRMEYDGLIRYSLEIVPRRPLETRRLSLEIPLAKFRYFHSSGTQRVPHLYIMEKPKAGYIDPKVETWEPGKGTANPQGMAPALYFPSGSGVIWASTGLDTQRNITGAWLPYIWIGNPRFGLGWLADSDRGWIHDQTNACQDLVRSGDRVCLRLHFISGSTLRDKRTIEFALIATPVRPRVTGSTLACHIGDYGFGFVPKSGGWADISCSDFYMARPIMEAKKNTGSGLLYIDNVLHSLGNPDVRYVIHEWEDEPISDIPFSADQFNRRVFGMEPWGYMARYVNSFPSRTDYLLWWLDQWMEKGGVDGIYLDDTFPVASKNVQQPGCGYIRDDGIVQGAVGLFETREFLKRVAVLAYQRNTRCPREFLHMTGSMIPGCFSFSEYYLDGENDWNDFMDYWPLPRLEVFGAGAYGGNQAWLPMIKLWGEAALKDTRRTRQVHAMMRQYDMCVWLDGYNPVLKEKFLKIEATFGVDKEDCRFIGYWDEDSRRILALPDGVIAGMYVRPAKGALVYLTNLLKTEQAVPLRFDLQGCGSTAGKMFDAETDREIAAEPLAIPSHDFRIVRVEPLK